MKDNTLIYTSLALLLLVSGFMLNEIHDVDHKLQIFSDNLQNIENKIDRFK